MKNCHACGLDLPLVEFPPNRARGDGRQSMCRPCYSEYQRDYYRRRTREDPEYRSRVRKNKRERRVVIRRDNHHRMLAFFAEHPCRDCGEDDPIVLEFDHVRGDKRFNISDRLHSMSWDRLLREIAKCEVVCANCHRRRSARRGEYYAGLA